MTTRPSAHRPRAKYASPHSGPGKAQLRQRAGEALPVLCGALAVQPSQHGVLQQLPTLLALPLQSISRTHELLHQPSQRNPRTRGTVSRRDPALLKLPGLHELLQLSQQERIQVLPLWEG